MPFLLLALLFSLPILEILVFLRAAEGIGWLSVIGLTLLTAVIGTAVIRAQGLSALAKAQGALADGKAPVESVIDGVFLLVCAPLLMTPGFLTDAAGFLLLVPRVRHTLAREALKRLKRAQERGTITIIRPR